MTFLRRLIFGNWPLKLAALGLATVLYAGVALSDSTRTWAGPVPIEVLRAPVGGALLELPGVVDEISYQSTQEVANQLGADSFRASIDLSAVQPQVGAEPVPVVVDVFPVDPRVRVVGYSPRSINVRLDQVVTRRLPVTVGHGVLPDGIELGPVSAAPSTATVSGASSRVQNVRSVEGRVAIDASGINIDQDVPVEAFDELGALVPGVEVDPPSVRVSADVARQLAYATLPVLPQLTGQPMRGRRVDDVSVVPATIGVSGEEAAVRQLEAITTEPIDITGQETELMTEVPFVMPSGVSVPEGAVATVIVTFTEDEGSRAVELGTALVGARADRTYLVEDSVVSVVVSGPVTALDELDVADLIVEVPVADLDVGSHEVTPRVQLPGGLQVARTLPEVVRVTVEEATSSRLFGTDGIRGVANEDLKPSLAHSLGRAVASRLAAGHGRILVGQDTRRSGDMLVAALMSGGTSAGADVHVLGVCPTPALAYVTAAAGYSAGIMVSASHNPADDNGLKIRRC